MVGHCYESDMCSRTVCIGDDVLSPSPQTFLILPCGKLTRAILATWEKGLVIYLDLL
jgi:hypothetical protein